MKKILFFVLAMGLLSSCYDDYVRDFDYTAGYVMYQYDLRTFVIGEGMKFDVSVAMSGVVENEKDRHFEVVLDNSLCTEDLSKFGADGKGTSFYAIDGMLGNGKLGHLAGGASSYVTEWYKNSGLKSLTPLPASYYDLDFTGMTVKSHDVAGYATVTAHAKAQVDPNMFKPYYAIGYRIVSADVDEVVKEKSFAVIGVRCENKYYGNWYHGGSYTVNGASVKYPFSIPQEDGKSYTLTTVDANTVKTDKYVQNKGTLYLTFTGSEIKISSPDVHLVSDSRKSYAKETKLLQDRVLYLNYSYLDDKDRVVVVSDSLMFRNRIRDGINEWQDTDPTHYE